jgi:hypothetical protein
MKKYLILVLLLVATLASCKKNNEIKFKEFDFDFNQSAENWEVFFSDYPIGEEDFYELEFSHSYLPQPLDVTKMSVKISGNNHSDDLLSFIVRKFENLKPNTVYSVTFNVELASNATTNGIGIGGSPDLALGFGGLAYQPANNINQGYYRPNFISLLQSGGSNEVIKSAGRIGVSPDSPAAFTLINRNNLSEPIQLKTNGDGELWLMIGTDSGFEGPTMLYFKSINIRME